ncbi:MAG: polysaccharide biosynthesis/export family protein [Paludibacteraceae bacterium]|nr:polysaccharide biosynthesis/export family protein [Paludibacteraceae bacterium]
MRKQFLLVIVAIGLLTGCASPRQMTLFAGHDATANVGVLPKYTIETGDILLITFSSVNPEVVAPYNSAGTHYEVDENGMVEMPVLGRVKLAGLTTDEAIKTLTEMAQGPVREPIVRLTIDNAVITFLGEVVNPSCIRATQPIAFAEALGRVGGITKNAKCKDVVVQRRSQGKTQRYHINLLTDEIFSSPCYYLQKGDMVYIAPLHAK